MSKENKNIPTGDAFTERFYREVAKPCDYVTEEELREMAGSYDPNIYHGSVAVTHHNKADDEKTSILNKELAWGKVDGLKYNEDEKKLYADFSVLPEIKEHIDSGRLNDRSICYWKKHKVTGKPYFAHLALLAVTPAKIQGMSRLSWLSEDHGELKTTLAAPITTPMGGKQQLSGEHTDLHWSIRKIGEMLRKIREFYIETVGRDKADQIVPDWGLSDLESSAEPPDEEDKSEFSDSEGTQEGDMKGTDTETIKLSDHETLVTAAIAKATTEATATADTEKKALSDENTTLKGKVAKLEEGIAAAKNEAKTQKVKTHLSDMVTAGKIPPAEVGSLEAVYVTLSDTALTALITADKNRTVKSFGSDPNMQGDEPKKETLSDGLRPKEARGYVDLTDDDIKKYGG